MEAIKHSDDYSNQSIDETLAELNSDISRGLTDSEAQQRITRFGYNEIESKEATWLERMLHRFWWPIPRMIEAAQLVPGDIIKLRIGDSKTGSMAI